MYVKQTEQTNFLPPTFSNKGNNFNKGKTYFMDFIDDKTFVLAIFNQFLEFEAALLLLNMYTISIWFFVIITFTMLGIIIHLLITIPNHK